MKIEAAIIIPTRADDSCVIELVESLVQDPLLIGIVVVVVVNGDRPLEGVLRGLESLREAASRRIGMEIRIGRIDRSSKPAAINLGEEIAGDPDFHAYVDDDITILQGSLSRVFGTLRDAGDSAALVAPRRAVDSREGRVSRLFGACVLRPRWTRNGVCMGGCFAVNRSARRRWDRGWPRMRFAVEIFSAHTSARVDPEGRWSKKCLSRVRSLE